MTGIFIIIFCIAVAGILWVEKGRNAEDELFDIMAEKIEELEDRQERNEKKQPAKIAYIVVKTNEKERTVAVDTVFYSFDKAYYYCEAEEEKEENKDCRFHVLQRIIEND